MNFIWDIKIDEIEENIWFAKVRWNNATGSKFLCLYIKESNKLEFNKYAQVCDKEEIKLLQKEFSEYLWDSEHEWVLIIPISQLYSVSFNKKHTLEVINYKYWSKFLNELDKAIIFSCSIEFYQFLKSFLQFIRPHLNNILNNE